MKRMQRVYLVALVMAWSVGCDQFSKNLAEENLKYAKPRRYFGNVFRLEYAENTGAFLSMGAELPALARTWLFTVLSGVLLVGLLYYVLTHSSFTRKHVFALALILGGGSSNLIDRITNDGRVVDFMNMGIGSLRTGIFNFADVAIMTGMGLIVFLTFFERSDEQEARDPARHDGGEAGDS